MASVKVHTGEFPSAVGVAPGYELSRVVGQWAVVAGTKFNLDCDWLIRMIDETERLRLWEVSVGGFTYPDRDTFLRKQVLLDFELTAQQTQNLVAALRGGRQDQAQKILSARDQEIRARHAAGETQTKIAAEKGVSQQLASQITRDIPSNPRLGRQQCNLYPGTDPVSAAARIRERLGDDFAAALGVALLHK